jgi:hypothetical protein
MKIRLFIVATATVLFCALLLPRLFAADSQPVRTHEYVTIRWAGRDNTHIIRPGGQVEFVGAALRKVVRPDRADDRAFYMNIVMNGLTKDGYRFVGMNTDEIVMEREVK